MWASQIQSDSNHHHHHHHSITANNPTTLVLTPLLPRAVPPPSTFSPPTGHQSYGLMTGPNGTTGTIPAICCTFDNNANNSHALSNGYCSSGGTSVNGSGVHHSVSNVGGVAGGHNSNCLSTSTISPSIVPSTLATGLTATSTTPTTNCNSQSSPQQSTTPGPGHPHHGLFHPTPGAITAALNSTPTPILSSDDTYICCAYSPRCFIIQKVCLIFFPLILNYQIYLV